MGKQPAGGLMSSLDLRALGGHETTIPDSGERVKSLATENCLVCDSGYDKQPDPEEDSLP